MDLFTCESRFKWFGMENSRVGGRHSRPIWQPRPRTWRHAEVFLPYKQSRGRPWLMQPVNQPTGFEPRSLHTQFSIPLFKLSYTRRVILRRNWTDVCASAVKGRAPIRNRHVYGCYSCKCVLLTNLQRKRLPQQRLNRNPVQLENCIH